jgi:hypothetical protein
MYEDIAGRCVNADCIDVEIPSNPREITDLKDYVKEELKKKSPLTAFNIKILGWSKLREK